MTIITRRSVFGLIAAGVCAPAIVRISSIMPIRSFAEYPFDPFPAASNVASDGAFLVPDEFGFTFGDIARAYAALQPSHVRV